MAARVCRACGLPLGRWTETCARCGEETPIILPWYGLILGFVLALTAALAFGDLGGLVHLLARNFAP
jgi:hypothetical protein